MEYKSLIASRILKYNLHNKFYKSDLVKGQMLYESGFIISAFSPAKEKIITVAEDKTYSIVTLFNQSIKVSCSCNSSLCRHFIPTILYLKDHIDMLDEKCAEDDSEINISNMSVEQIVRYIRRRVGNNVFLIDEYVSEFKFAVEKVIDKIVSEKSHDLSIFELLAIISIVDNKILDLNIPYLVYSLLDYVSTLPEEVVIKGIDLICQRIHFSNMCMLLKSFDEKMDKVKYCNLLDYLINITKKLKLYDAFDKLETIKGNYLLTNISGEAFYEYAKDRLSNSNIKLNFFNYLLFQKKYDEILKYYESDNDTQIRKIYCEALSYSDDNIDTLNKILDICPEPSIIKRYHNKGLIKDNNVIYERFKTLTFERRADLCIALEDYDKLFELCTECSFSNTMKYCKPLYNNKKELFIPYFEKNILDLLKQNTRFSTITNHLKILKAEKFASIYLKELILYAYNYNYIRYDDVRSANNFLRDLDI